MWAERGIRAWADGWWRTPMEVGDQIGRIVGAPRGSTVMCQNVAIAEAIALSCFRPVDPTQEPRRVRARELPLGALPVPGAARPRGGRVRGRRRDRRADRRAHAARPDQPRPLQGLPDSGRRADRAPRARGRCFRDPRLLPVGWDRPGRPDGARRGLRGRRVGEVAVRRAGERLVVRSARPRGTARANVRGLAGARSPVRLRGGARVHDRRGALPHRDAQPRRSHGRDGRVRPHRGSRRRAHPRELAQADGAAHRARRGSRLRDPLDARSVEARRRGDRRRARGRRRVRRARASERSSATSDPAPAFASARTSSRATTRFGTRSRRSRTSSRRAPTSATWAPPRCTDRALEESAVEGHDDGTAHHRWVFVYRGAAVPEARGRYFFGDYCTGAVWSLLDGGRRGARRPAGAGEEFRGS